MEDFLKSFILLLSMDHSKNDFKNNSFIFKLDYFISFLIIISFFFINFLKNYFSPFITTTSIL